MVQASQQQSVHNNVQTTNVKRTEVLSIYTQESCETFTTTHGKFPLNSQYRRSTTVSLETYPLYYLNHIW